MRKSYWIEHSFQFFRNVLIRGPLMIFIKDTFYSRKRAKYEKKINRTYVDGMFCLRLGVSAFYSGGSFFKSDLAV